jgi:hypothetical protein
MSALSTLGLLRSRGPRAFASIATPQRLQFHRPRYISNIRVKDNATIIKDYEHEVKKTLEDPNLNDEQKYRISKRLYALIDYRVAFGEASRNHEAARDAAKHAEGLEASARSEYVSHLKNLLQEQLALETKRSTLLWRAYMLVVFAPWGDVGLVERIARLYSLLVINGLIAPFKRLRLRLALIVARTMEKNS